jgi:hypothetical protein
VASSRALDAIAAVLKVVAARLAALKLLFLRGGGSRALKGGRSGFSSPVPGRLCLFDPAEQGFVPQLVRRVPVVLRVVCSPPRYPPRHRGPRQPRETRLSPVPCSRLRPCPGRVQPPCAGSGGGDPCDEDEADTHTVPGVTQPFLSANDSARADGAAAGQMSALGGKRTFRGALNEATRPE